MNVDETPGVRDWQWGPSEGHSTGTYSNKGGYENYGNEPPSAGSTATFDSTESRQNISLLLMRLHVKTNNTTVESHYALYNAKALKISNANAEVLIQMEQQALNIAKAEKSGQIGEIFGYVATAVTLVAAAVTLNPALIMASVISVGMIIATETGCIDKLIEEIGMEGFIAIMVVLSLCMMFAPSGFSGAAGAGTAYMKNANQMIAAADMASGSAMIGSGVSKVVSSKYVYDAAMINGVVTRIVAGAETDRGELEDTLAYIEAAMERYYLIFQQSRNMLESSWSTSKYIASV